MGLLDQVIGSVLGGAMGGLGGGRGGQQGSGLSPIVQALLMLLASKAMNGGLGDIFGGGAGAPGGGTMPRHPRAEPEPDDQYADRGPPSGSRGGDGSFGDLSGYLDPPGGRAAGAGQHANMDSDPQESPAGGGGGLGGNLGGLIDSFQRGGLGDVLNSWIGSGQNQPIAPNQLGSALGPDTVDALSRQTGLDRGDLLAQLAQALPGVVDKLTPHGRPPTPEETRHW